MTFCLKSLMAKILSATSCGLTRLQATFNNASLPVSVSLLSNMFITHSQMGATNIICDTKLMESNKSLQSGHTSYKSIPNLICRLLPLFVFKT